MQTYVSVGEAIRGKQEGCNFSIEKLQHVWRRNSSSLHKMMTKSMKRSWWADLRTASELVMEAKKRWGGLTGTNV